MLSTGNASVDAIGQINLVGNSIPHRWFGEILLANGKPDLNAIILLSEIVYWYRPRIVRDEDTGIMIGVKARFKADLLQRSYDSFSKQFGLTKRQVSDAIKRLEDNNLILRVFRTVKTPTKVLSNVLFIQINHIKIKEISDITPPITLQRDTPSHVKTEPLSRYNVTPSHVKTEHPPTLKRETYTEDYYTENKHTETTTEYISSDFKKSNEDSDLGSADILEENPKQPKKLNIEFDVFWEAYQKKVGSQAKLQKKWSKLTNKDREAIMMHVPRYVLATPDKQFRKNPETYLNNKSWNDEIIVEQPAYDPRATPQPRRTYQPNGETPEERVKRRSAERAALRAKDITGHQESFFNNSPALEVEYD